MTWLHFVGRQYYTRSAFIREAKRYGVTRRVALQTLARMNWGDGVVLAMKEGATPVVFGTFQVERLSGLSHEASERLRDLYPCEVVPGAGRVVHRGCGSYEEAPFIILVRDAPLPEIAQHLMVWKTKGMDIGKPMVGGAFRDHPLVYLRDVPHQQGFRPFDLERFEAAFRVASEALTSSGRRRIPTVRGQFYAQPTRIVFPYEEEDLCGEGELVVLNSYRRADTA